MPAAGRSPGLWLWAAALIVCGSSLWRLGGVCVDQLAAPFDLVYETPNLRSIELLQQGRPIYRAAIYEQAPWWPTPYTPLYHQLVSLLPPAPTNPFLPGRLLAMACMLLAAATLLIVGGREVPLSLLAIGLFFLIPPVTSNTAFLKNDSLALLLSVGAVVMLARARARLSALAASAVLCALALWSKQSYGAAAAACSGWLLFTQGRRGLLHLGICLATLLLLGAWVWDDGFLFSVFGALQNPMLASHFLDQLRPGLSQPVVVALATLGLGWLLVACLRRRWSVLLATPYPLYALIASAWMLISLPKIGSSLNYYIEPGLALLAALLDRGRVLGAAAAARMLGLPGVSVLALASAAGAELWLVEPRGVAFTSARDTAARLQEHARIEAEVEGSLGPDPRTLNLYRAGLSYPAFESLELSDPLLYSLLWEQGRLSPEPVIAAVRAGEFDAVLLPKGMLRAPSAVQPWPPALMYALRASYRIGWEYGPLQVLVRRRL